MTGTILIVGDGIAEGVGDSLAHGGLATRLNRLLAKHRHETKLNFEWQAVTAGKLYSTSRDWLPSRDNANSSSVKNESLFHTTFFTGPFRSAKVVVILLGSHDDVVDGSATASNIAELAHAIARLEKHVLVCHTPVFPSSNAESVRLAQARNLALGEALSSSTSRSANPSASVTFGVELQKILFRGADVISAGKDFLTLNSFGYRSLARDILDEVTDVARRVEWRHWSSQLMPSSRQSA